MMQFMRLEDWCPLSETTEFSLIWVSELSPGRQGREQGTERELRGLQLRGWSHQVFRSL
jgi:hypothetical protein